MDLMVFLVLPGFISIILLSSIILIVKPKAIEDLIAFEEAILADPISRGLQLNCID